LNAATIEKQRILLIPKPLENPSNAAPEESEQTQRRPNLNETQLAQTP
jgi:hypothetical protein